MLRIMRELAKTRKCYNGAALAREFLLFAAVSNLLPHKRPQQNARSERHMKMTKDRLLEEHT
jgi:hypothetical protein